MPCNNQTFIKTFTINSFLSKTRKFRKWKKWLEKVSNFNKNNVSHIKKHDILLWVTPLVSSIIIKLSLLNHSIFQLIHSRSVRNWINLMNHFVMMIFFSTKYIAIQAIQYSNTKFIPSISYWNISIGNSFLFKVTYAYVPSPPPRT